MPGPLTADELVWMKGVVTAALDVTVIVQRNTPGLDGSGHTTETWTTVNSAAQVNVIKPSATQLQAFAGIIGSQWALMIRFMPESDIRENDRIVYMGRNWKVQNVQNAESFTFANDALLTVLV